VNERLESPGSTDDWLDRALTDNAREHADLYIPDDGFTARVMTALPAAVALPAWRKPALTALWAAAGVGLAITVPGIAVDVAREAFKLLAAKPFALSEIAAVLLMAGAGMWSTAYFTWKRV
jgi:hypothetical protein